MDEAGIAIIGHGLDPDRGGEDGEVGALLHLGELALRLGRVARGLGQILALVADELGGDAVALGQSRFDRGIGRGKLLRLNRAPVSQLDHLLLGVDQIELRADRPGGITL